MKKNLDPHELLPFCMRCFGVGLDYEVESNYCHECGSSGTCIPVSRMNVAYLQMNIQERMEWERNKGRTIPQ